MTTLTLTPTSGPPGATITASGTGFRASQNLRLYVGAAIVAAAVCDEHGTFSTPLRVPDGATGDFVVRVAVATSTAAKYVVAAPAPPPPPPPTGTTRMVMWCNARYVCDMSDADLDRFAAMGVGGFVMQTNDLAPGGGQFFTVADPPPAPTSGADRNLVQRRIRQTDIVARCKARGIDPWLGFYLAQGTNKQTPLVPWTADDVAWKPFLDAITDLATFAAHRGFVGLALDEEMYRGGTWEWNYPGNTHAESQVRTATQFRGGHVMQAINLGFPAADLITYGWLITDSWNGQRVQADRPAFKTMVNIDFWKGMTALAGFSALRFWDATFYRGTQVSGAAGTWEAALPEAARLLRDGFAKNFDHWPTIAGKVYAEPFAWIDGIPGATGFNAAQTDPAKVAKQLAAMATFTEGDVVGIYSWGRPNLDFLAPFAPGILAASRT